VELDLVKYRGYVPVEMFGFTEMPRIGEHPYLLTLSPHAFFWLSLNPPPSTEPAPVSGTRSSPVISATSWEELIRSRNARALSDALTRYLRGRRWFAGKAGHLKGAEVIDLVEIPGSTSVMSFLRVEYSDGEAEIYTVPLGIAGRRESDLSPHEAEATIASLRSGNEVRTLYEAVWDRDLWRGLLDVAARRRVLKGRHGEIHGSSNRLFKQLRGNAEVLEATVLRAEQSNTSVVFGDKFFMKLFRKLEAGLNPDLEVSQFLTEKTEFRNTPQMTGSLEYEFQGTLSTLTILQQNIPNGGDAWGYTLDALGNYFERIISQTNAIDKVRSNMPRESLLQMTEMDLPKLADDLIESYVDSAQLLGRRTAELHMALASRPDDPVFAPEPFTPHYQRSIYQHMRTYATRGLHLLRRKLKELGETERLEAEQLLTRETELLTKFRSLLTTRITGSRIRIHGDYHLGQILYTGRDFFVIDFEGEPSRPLSERRIKRSALRDVAGMLRSFHYAPHAVLFGQAQVVVRPEDAPVMEVAGRYWHRWVSGIFLKSYLQAAAGQLFLPQSENEVQVLLRSFLLEKACYEIAYELNNRPKWVGIPIRGVLQLLDEPEK
jgi:maltose alpha-D-glucosyltransferase/alpha-amylase